MVRRVNTIAVSSQLHYQIIRSLLDTGRCPSHADLQQSLHLSEAGLESAFRDLEAVHGIVLHPDRVAPWIIHPFSLTPTATWVEAAGRGWWAPCLWCAFGIATLATGAVRIHSRLGGEAEPVVVALRDGHLIDGHQYCVHFAIRPSEAWNNVHAHCALLLPFRTPRDVHEWTVRHRLPLGEVVSLAQTAALAHRWYGRHADPDWRKWTIVEAQAIFEGVGFRSEFFRLAGQNSAPEGTF